ncbi:hypothetical protein [Neisseria meningitidis]|uniref:hypothetical protein n=1 Tax=Neisseria meningitidis TaxID=487 RepID=UPI0012968BD8|nr:hypothetical protein [Neisseria meningitidis]
MPPENGAAGFIPSLPTVGKSCLPEQTGFCPNTACGRRKPGGCEAKAFQTASV